MVRCTQLVIGTFVTRSARGAQFRARPVPRTGGRVVLTRSAPLAVVRKPQPLEEQRIDGVAEENLGEWILAIWRVEQASDALLGDLEQLVAGERRLVVFDLLFDPLVIALARDGVACGHSTR